MKQTLLTISLSIGLLLGGALFSHALTKVPPYLIYPGNDTQVLTTVGTTTQWAASQGGSGSFTTTTINGLSSTNYTLIPGTNITISTSSPGNITINSTGGGAGNPAGSSTQIQYNNNGVFGGSSDLTYTSSTNTFANSGLSQFIGAVSIGMATSSDTLLRIYGDNGALSRIAIRGYSNNNAGSSFRTSKFRGTASAPLAVQSGDNLGNYQFAGYSGLTSDAFAGAYISGYADENWGVTSYGTDMRFYTTLNGTAGPVQRMVIDNNGKIGIATTTPSEALTVSGNIKTTSLNTGIVKSTAGILGNATSGIDYIDPTGLYSANFITSTSTAFINTTGLYAPGFITSTSTAFTTPASVSSSLYIPGFITATSTAFVNSTQLYATQFITATSTAFQSPLGFIPASSTRAINTAANSGLSGGGDLTADRNLILNLGGGSTQSCGAGSHFSSATATGTLTCTTDSGGGGGGGGLASTTPFSAGYIPFATSSNSITNSNIFQSGTNIGVGTTTPASTFTVNGDIQISSPTAKLTFGDNTIQSSGLKSFQWTATYASSTSIFPDDFFTFHSSSTLKYIDVKQQAAGDTLTFNLYYANTMPAATSTGAFKVFSTDQTITSTSTAELTPTASSTPGLLNFLRIHAYNASTTEFTLTGYYQDN